MVEFASATVVITTKNRKEDLRNAITSALSQSARPEVIVIDDGSSDGTSDMVHAEFPQARVYRVEVSLGLIRQRNRGAQLATGDVIFSIDDDAAFSSPHVVSQTLAEFDDPRVGAVAIPFVNVNQDPRVMQRAPEESGVFVTNTYIGTAHAVRRDLFNRLGGYRGHLIHQGEESDFCIRLLSAGYVVRLGRADVIHHFESPRRNLKRMDYYGRRNDVLFAWHNVPWPYFPIHLLATTVNGVRAGISVRRPIRMCWALICGWVACIKYARLRQPVPATVYRSYRKLKRSEATEISTLKSSLPSTEQTL